MKANAITRRSSHAEHIGTIRGRDIEEPVKAFLVEFTQRSLVNAYLFCARRRVVRVMAETPEGAVRIARTHFPESGQSFAVLTGRSIRVRRHGFRCRYCGRCFRYPILEYIDLQLGNSVLVALCPSCLEEV